MRVRYSIITLLGLLFCFHSCIEPIEMVGDDSWYVVNCTLTQSARQTITVKFNKTLLSNFEASISDLSAGGTSYPYFPYENSILSGYLDFTPVPGHEYLLNVRINDQTTLTAKTTFPNPAELEVRSGEGVWDSPECTHVRVLTDSADPMWMWGTYLGGDLAMTGLLETRVSKHITCNYPGTDSFNLINLTISDYCTDETGVYMHDKFLRVTNCKDGDAFSVFAYDDDHFFQEHPDSHGLQVICVSEDYDRFLRETASLAFKRSGGLQKENGVESWFEVYDHNNYYTNIQGGTGIFGAYVSCKMTRL